MFTNCLDLIDNPIMTKAQFIKDTETRLLRLSLKRSGHEVGIEEILSVLDKRVAVDIVRGGQQQVEAVDQVIGDAGVGRLHADEQSPAEVKQLPRCAGRPFALP